MTADPHAARYDEVPYPNLVHGRSHPRTVGAMGVLYGLDAPPVETARVLDLGCAAGMNILAMADELPRATFVGVDISPGQIAAARDLALDLGLANITFECASFEDLSHHAPGSFDYIVCHGVFSWVKPALRQVILDLIKRLLAPAGLAYVSYNTYPGWHFGNIVRELMLREMDPSSPPLERVLEARRTLERHIEAVEDKSLRRALLLAEREMLAGHSDSYLFHEYLTPEHHPLYFQEFAELARTSGFAYVSDSLPGIVLPGTQSPRLEHLIAHLPPASRNDPIAQQQAIDYHLDNRFRRSVLAHDHHQPALTLDPHGLARLHLRLPRDHVLVREDGGALSVRSRRGRLIPIRGERQEAMLEQLRAASPASVPVLALLPELAASSEAQTSPELRVLCGMMVGLVFAEVLEATLSAVECASTLPTHPAVPRLNRQQARRGDPIASRVFNSEIVGDLGLSLVSRLDGHRSIDELTSELGVARDKVEALLRSFVDHAILLPSGTTSAR